MKRWITWKVHWVLWPALRVLVVALWILWLLWMLWGDRGLCVVLWVIWLVLWVIAVILVRKVGSILFWFGHFNDLILLMNLTIGSLSWFRKNNSFWPFLSKIFQQQSPSFEMWFVFILFSFLFAMMCQVVSYPFLSTFLCKIKT